MSESTTRFLHVFEILSQALKAPSLAFDAENNCCLTFKDGVAVHLHLNEDEDELLVYSEVADLGQIEDKREILTKLLNADFLWIATRGFTLSMAQDDYEVILAGHQDLDYFTDEKVLVQYIVAFADIVRKWMELIGAESLPSVGAIFPPLSLPDDENDIMGDISDIDRLNYGRFSLLWI